MINLESYSELIASMYTSNDSYDYA